MKKIGLLSDTHGVLDNRVFDYFKEVDEIWHAGDIGTIEVLDELNEFKPTIAVFGNIDGGDLRIDCKETVLLRRDGLKVLITHIAGKPPRYNPRVLSLVQEHRPNVLICGHSHILKVEFDKRNQLLFMNPGAAGNHGFHKVKTLLRFGIENMKVKDLEVIELGKRGAISQ
ncbi:MAG: metallophosphoesterase family protein [Cyclobacteriaceae bacterium]